MTLIKVRPSKGDHYILVGFYHKTNPFVTNFIILFKYLEAFQASSIFTVAWVKTVFFFTAAFVNWSRTFFSQKLIEFVHVIFYIPQSYVQVLSECIAAKWIWPIWHILTDWMNLWAAHCIFLVYDVLNLILSWLISLSFPVILWIEPKCGLIMKEVSNIIV